MSDNELKEWFWNKFNSCYCVKHEDYPHSIFMYYDVNFIRKAKFRILQDKEIKYPDKVVGTCLFEQNYKNMWIICVYDNIWSFFESNSNHNYQEIKKLIKGWLEEDSKLKVLTPATHPFICNWHMEESKLKVI